MSGVERKTLGLRHCCGYLEAHKYLFLCVCQWSSVWYVSEMRFTAAERKRKRESRGSSIWVTLCWRRRQSGFPPAIQRHITQHIKTRHRPLTHNPPLKQKRLQNDHKHPSHSRAGHTSESIQITTDLSCAKLTNAMLRGSWWLLTVPTVKTSQAAAIFWSLYGFSMQVWQI